MEAFGLRTGNKFSLTFFVINVTFTVSIVNKYIDYVDCKMHV